MFFLSTLSIIVRKVNLLKRQLRQLSAGAAKLERASFAVSSPDVSLGIRAMASVVAGVGSLEAEPFFAEDERRRGSAIETRRATTAPMINAQPSPKSMRDRENSQRCGDLTRVNNTHAPAASINAASNIAVAVGRETTGRVGSARPSGAEEDQTGRSRKGDAPHEASVRAGTEAFQAKSAVSSGSEMERLSPRVKNTDRHPCPLSGVLDMLEPPLRRDRRSFFSDDGRVYSSVTTREGGLLPAEPVREDKLMDCVLDSEGVVRHGKNCILGDMVETKGLKVKTVKGRAQEDWSSRASVSDPLTADHAK